jgi:alanine racemase
MSIDRRDFLASLALAPNYGARQDRLQRSPILASNYDGITPAQARRANAWRKIDVVQFETNLAELRRLIGGRVARCAVMKADAYGHGIDLLLPSVMAAGVCRIGFASNEEARARESGGADRARSAQKQNAPVSGAFCFADQPGCVRPTRSRSGTA